MTEQAQKAPAVQDVTATGTLTGHDAAGSGEASSVAAAPSNQPGAQVAAAAIVVDAPAQNSGGQRMVTRPASMKVRLCISASPYGEGGNTGDSGHLQLGGGRGEEGRDHDCMPVFARLRHVGKRRGTSALFVENVHSLTLLSPDIGVMHLYVCVAWDPLNLRARGYELGWERIGQAK